jgi:hypothetical protein
MRWVTLEDAANTRMISGWLIKRFIDPEAEFAFVPKGTDPATVDGIAFHIEGGGLSPKEGPLSKTYQVILDEYHLLEKNPPAFGTFMEIYAEGAKAWMQIRTDPAARLRDALPPNAPPESGGLMLALLGIRLTEKDDQERLRSSSRLFDWFYGAIRIRAEQAAAAEATQQRPA